MSPTLWETLRSSSQEIVEHHVAQTPSYVAHLVGHPWTVLAGVGYAILAVGATAAIFSKSIKDTPLEMVALTGIAIFSASRCFYVIGRGIVPLDAVGLSASLALFVIAIWLKKRKARNMPRRRSNDIPPDDHPARREGDDA